MNTIVPEDNIEHNTESSFMFYVKGFFFLLIANIYK